MRGYELLIGITPELEQWRALPHRLELVGAIDDPVVRMLAEQDGIHYIIFSTPETDQYIDMILPRFRQAPRPGGLIP